jgi:putative radical SAM enzyme (TIGR03279 family)
MIITAIKPKSSAEKKGLRSGDTIVSINGAPVRDMLDFYLYASVLPLEIVVMRDGKKISVEFTTYHELIKLGIAVEDLKIRHCGNRCVFCFVDQNPKKLRKTLYIKDEDYRYSYLYGAFCTLSKIAPKELNRIVEQHLSPLYISVHAIDKKIRLKLLGLENDDHFIEKLTFLADNGIQFHTQIVLCPGINDGRVLVETIESLYRFYPAVLSVAVVPLGKTKFRSDCADLASVNESDARKVIAVVNRIQKRAYSKTGTRFVFAADEFYLKSGSALPRNAEYEEYQQYENGVGMVRYYLHALSKARKSFPAKIKKPRSVLIVTGKSFYPVVRRNLLPALSWIGNLAVHAVAVHNHFLGDEITVSGLLCGKDIISAVNESGISADFIVIPETSLNTDGVTLDDMSIGDLAKSLKAKVITSDQLFALITSLT